MRLRSTTILGITGYEPVTMAEAKSQLRLLPEQTEDDVFINGLIATGRALVERRLGIALVTKQVKAVFDNEEPPIDWRLAASFMPTLTIQSTQYRAALGITEPYVTLPVSKLLIDAQHPLSVVVDDLSTSTAIHTTVSQTQYYVDADSQPSVVRFVNMPYVPARGTLSVTYYAGPLTTGDVAPQLKSAILLYVGHLYLHREAVGDHAEQLPLAFETLLASESVTGRW
jgi:hypothetical protein